MYLFLEGMEYIVVLSFAFFLTYSTARWSFFNPSCNVENQYWGSIWVKTFHWPCVIIVCIIELCSTSIKLMNLNMSLYPSYFHVLKCNSMREDQSREGVRGSTPFWVGEWLSDAATGVSLFPTSLSPQQLLLHYASCLTSDCNVKLKCEYYFNTATVVFLLL